MPKKGITFALAFDQSQFSRTVRKDGRVVEYTGLENRRAERHRGFESLSFRKHLERTPVRVSLFIMPRPSSLLEMVEAE